MITLMMTLFLYCAQLKLLFKAKLLIIVAIKRYCKLIRLIIKLWTLESIILITRILSKIIEIAKRELTHIKIKKLS